MIETLIKHLMTLDREYLMVPIYLVYHVFLYKVGYWKMVDKHESETK